MVPDSVEMFNKTEILRQFDRIDAESGFICASSQPITRLSDPCYEPWEAIVDILPALLMTSQVRNIVHKITERLLSDRKEVERAALVLSFIGHAYVRGGPKDKTVSILPQCIARPWKIVSAHLGIYPILSHATTVLYNWAPIDQTQPLSLDNLRTLNTITGSPDESWFYLNSVAVDCHGGSQLLTIIFDILNGIANNGFERLVNTFSKLKILIDETTMIFERMYEYNFPNVFYKRVRPYLAGWTNDKALPDGLHYGAGSPGEFYAGASVSQGAFFQAIDIALGIQHPIKGHHEEAAGTNVGLPGAYLKDMRNYMPRSHRDFLNWLEGHLDVSAFMHETGQHHPQLKEAYNNALKAMEAFRTSHVKMVSLYIITQAHKEDHTEVQGTGGSNPIPFLKAIRSHVHDAELP